MTAAAEMPATPYTEAALDYLRAGWSPIPLPLKRKHPVASGFTGARGAMVSGADVQTWIDHGMAWEDEKGKRRISPAGNIALRLPLEIVGIDVDMYEKGGQQKAGRASLERLESQYGPLPATFMTTARSDGSGIRLFRVPPGLNWPGAPLPGIEVIQFRHRYAMVWPSWNPDAGAPYRWVDQHGNSYIGIPTPDDMTLMPDGWIEGLTHGELATEVDREDLSDAQALEWMRAHGGDDVMCPRMEHAMKMAIEGGQVGDGQILGILTSGSGARHDTATRATASLAHLAAEGHKGVRRALEAAHTAFQYVTTGESRPGEWTRMVTGAIGVASARQITTVGDPCRDPYTGSHPPITARPSQRVHALPSGTTVAGVQPSDNVYTSVGAGIWDSRPELRFIYEGARAQLASPWATLGIILARVIAATPSFVVLPRGIIGPYGSLNSFFALVGRPGAGKGIATAVAADIFHIKQPAELFNAGSGEGLAHLYAKRVRVTKDEGGGTRVDRIRDSVMLNVPEVDSLTALSGRQGATLISQLRQAWSGEALGFAYADQEKALTIPSLEYRMSMIVGVQPEKAGPLMEDAGGGTPQRFVWLSTQLEADIDPDADIPEFTEAWPWDAPGPWHGREPKRAPMEVPEWIRKTIRKENTWMRQHPGESELDEHHHYARLKVAAGFALMASRAHITGEDWELSGELMAVSMQQRNHVVSILAQDRARKSEMAGMAEGHRELAKTKVVEKDALQQTRQAIIRWSSAAEWRPTQHYNRKLSSRLKAAMPEAFQNLVETGILEVHESERGTAYKLSAKIGLG